MGLLKAMGLSAVCLLGISLFIGGMFVYLDWATVLIQNSIGIDHWFSSMIAVGILMFLALIPMCYFALAEKTDG